MESSFLLEKKVICSCFNTLRDSVFFLSIDGDKLDLTEEDLSRNIILRRFKLLKQSECNIVNTNFRKMPKDTYEGYGLYFWELAKKILVVYPFGYLLIYDYNTSQLIHHFQCQGKKTYIIRNIIGSPLENSLFFSAELMRNIYHIYYDNIKNTVSYKKLVIPEHQTVFDLVCHPNEKFIFAGCSDSLIRIFDYSNPNKFVEITNGLVDVVLGKDNKPPKNQNELIKKTNILSVISLDINSNGHYLISGNENGFIYLWDAMVAIKNKRLLLEKEKLGNGIMSVKFLRTRQFENLNRFIVLTKEGKFLICNIIMKDENNSKIYSIGKLYENSIFNAINYSLTKYNLITSNFISISYFTNIISVKWPSLRMDKIKISPEKSEDYLLFTNFTAKFFFFYDNLFPKINFAISSQMNYKNYEEFIPISNKSNLVFERKIFYIDNFFIHSYDVMTGTSKKILHYSREFNLKAIYPLKFEVKNIDSIGEVYFVVLVENENYQKSVLFIHYDLNGSGNVKSAQRFEEINDFIILGDKDSEDFRDLLLLAKSKLFVTVYNIIESRKENKNIEGSILKMYWTPFCFGYTVLYRNALNELKFSSNLTSMEMMDFKNINDKCYRLDYSEREIDIIWKVK
jgi:WD40 repeat protein